MTEELFPKSTLDEAIRALKQDLLSPGGPRISTMRNYRFAIVPYRPAEEFKLRRLVRRMTEDLKAEGWSVLAVSLQRLFLDRVRALGKGEFERIVAREKRLYDKDPARALEHVREKIAPLIEGPEGIAADVARLIEKFAADAPEDEDRSLVLLGRAGALYPFFRSSSLLKHIDGKTRNFPVVLLYPGERRDTTTLSFMGEVPSDRDYRPRIYP